VVSVATVMVNGSSEQVLTNSSGYTLYYLTQDSASSVTCTGSCAQTWPPLVLASGQPTSSPSLPQALTTFTGGNGRQVEYDGHPLYHYTGDTGPDQSNGEGVNGVWFVATPSMASGGATATPTPSAAATATPSGAANPYGY
jgi:predicted lipoprotein with Yx(FWY)xxD motif